MQNDSANADTALDETVPGEETVGAGGADGMREEVGGDETVGEAEAAGSSDGTDSASKTTDAPAPAAAETAEAPEAAEVAEPADAAEMPQPRAAEGESPSGKGKKRKTTPKSKAAAATKSLVVFRDGKVHYSDESVVVLDLDEAAHPDTDVHDVVDKLSELRDAVESPGRTEAVALVAELIQAKALA